MVAVAYFPPGSVVVSQGIEFLKDYSNQRSDVPPEFIGYPINRKFCSYCGSRVLNILSAPAVAALEGVFPAGSVDHTNIVPQHLLPNFQCNPEEAVIMTSSLPLQPPNPL